MVIICYELTIHNVILALTVISLGYNYFTLYYGNKNNCNLKLMWQGTAMTYTVESVEIIRI